MATNNGFKCRCSNCGWTSRRAPKNISRPCPKCGGSVYVDQSEKDEYTVFAVLALIGTVLVLVLFAAAGVGS